MEHGRGGLRTPSQLRAVRQPDLTGPRAAGAERLGQGNFLEWAVELARFAGRAGWRRAALPQPVENGGRSDAILSGKLGGRSWANFKLVEELRPLLRIKSLTRERSVIALHSPACSTDPPGARQMGHR